MKILLIEDEILIQKSLKKLLEKRGATVEVTSSGSEAIQLIKDDHFDRIICDLMLTDLSGFDVLEECKSKYSAQEIKEKFVIITAYSSPNVLSKISAYGCRYLSKPFDNLISAIDVFLENE